MTSGALTFPDAITYFIDTAECRLPLRTYLKGHEPPLPDELKNAPDDCPASIPVEAR